MVIKQSFPPVPEVLANFPSEEVASGLSQVTFFGMASEDSGGVAYELVTNGSMWSSVAGTTQTGAGTTTINFDASAFNLPRTAKGTCYFSAGMATGNTKEVQLKVQVKHVDAGASETNISSEIAGENYTGTTADPSIMTFVKVPITTEKHFKKGDILRLTVKILQNLNGNSDMGHSPQNQVFNLLNTAAAHSSIMTFIMSFRSAE